MAKAAPLEVSPKDVKKHMDAGKPLRLVDVREKFEFDCAQINGAELIPMRSVPKALPLFEEEKNPIVVFCHHGQRSMQVVTWLREQGIENCQSLAGGIDRWSVEIDPKVPRYK